MARPDEYSWLRFLEAKRSVEDRCLNHWVWETFLTQLRSAPRGAPLRVLEVGAGSGAMAERLGRTGVLSHTAYTGIDHDPVHVEAARRRGGGGETRWEVVDLFDFLDRPGARGCWDVLIASAFLDLVDLPTTLPRLLRLLRPGGLFYFPINFDGATLLEPTVDAELDAHIEILYHQTMDRRQRRGGPSGDSRTGRHLFHHLLQSGSEILAAGASDWVVFPGNGTYPGDEEYFLHHLIHTVSGALKGHPELDQERFTRWIEERHGQADRGQLVYVAHQLDFVGRSAVLNRQGPDG